MFGWRGMGKTIFDAIMGNDFNLALVGLLFATAFTLFGNFLADVCYAWLDPRVSLTEERSLEYRFRPESQRPSSDMASFPATQACDGKSNRPIRADRGGSGGPLIESWLGVDAFTADLHQRLLDPSLDHPLGTDEIGRDHLVRLLYGGRVSLTVGLIAALFSAVIGTIIGICAGYCGGRLDSFLMRITDSVIALPLLLLIVLAAVDLTKLGIPEGLADAENMSLYRIVFIVSLVWTTVARR